MYFIKLLIIAMVVEIGACLGIAEKEEARPEVVVVKVEAPANPNLSAGADKSKSPVVSPISISLP